MNALAFTLTDSDSSRWIAMIEMIARKGPMMMRAGGGALSAGCETLACRRISSAERHAIIREYRSAWHADLTGGEHTTIISAIADRHAIHYNTVIRYTRDVRRNLNCNFSRAHQR